MKVPGCKERKGEERKGRLRVHAGQQGSLLARALLCACVQALGQEAQLERLSAVLQLVAQCALQTQAVASATLQVNSDPSILCIGCYPPISYAQIPSSFDFLVPWPWHSHTCIMQL